MLSSPVDGGRLARRVAEGLATAGLVVALALPAGAAPAFGPKDYVVTPGLPLPAIERFPACHPEKGGQLRVENGPDGSARVAHAVVVLNERETVMLEGQRRLVERAVQLAGTNTLLVSVVGPPGGTLRVSVASAGPCLDVAITSPPAGATVPAGTLLVQGTVTGPQHTGVSVNGFPAMVHDSRWAVEIPADSSVQNLTATASMVGDEPALASIPIAIASADSGSIELHAEPGDGIAPLVVTWKVVNNTGRALLQYELDSTGGGTFDPPVSSLDGAQTTYSTSGLWFPVLRALDDQGVTHTARIAILASEPASVSARFDVLWASFKSLLQTGDVSGALAFVAPSLRSAMERVLLGLGTDLPAVAASLGDVRVTDQVGELAEAILVRDDPSGRQLYFIQFRRDGLGRWLIEEM